MVDAGESRDPIEVVHFGCWHGAGHFFHDATGRLYAKEFGLPWEKVDGCLTPGRRDHRGRLDYGAKTRTHQGKAALHHLDGWTALAVHDFTIDSRPGSNTVLFFHALLDEEKALIAAEVAFPSVMQRMGVIDIVEVHTGREAADQ